jgi:pantetheine-phosphate adenylyltransferase
LGHLDIIERASRLYDRIVVAVGVNNAKQPFLSVRDRLKALEAISASLGNVEVDHFEGLLVAYAKQRGAQCVVRGLRATSDFDYEFQIAMANRRLEPQIETVFLMTKWEHSFLSSSVVREVATLGGDYTGFVHPEVAKIVAGRLA